MRLQESKQAKTEVLYFCFHYPGGQFNNLHWHSLVIRLSPVEHSKGNRARWQESGDQAACFISVWTGGFLGGPSEVGVDAPPTPRSTRHKINVIQSLPFIFEMNGAYTSFLACAATAIDMYESINELTSSITHDHQLWIGDIMWQVGDEQRKGITEEVRSLVYPLERDSSLLSQGALFSSTHHRICTPCILNDTKLFHHFCSLWLKKFICLFKGKKKFYLVSSILL